MKQSSAHPYKSAPNRAFWSRAVSNAFAATDLISSGVKLIRKADKVISAGSCFASNLVPYLDGAGLEYYRTESVHPAVAGAADDNFGYAKFSASYGNIYTVRQLLQLLRRCRGQFEPQEAFWLVDGEYVDPFRPGMKYRARTEAEFRALTRQHLDKVLEAFTNADVFVLTLGLTEGWLSKVDGAVFPACPGTVAGEFDPNRHGFHNFSASEVTADLVCFISEVRELNPDLRFIITVSPVPLVATATGDHVLSASTYSKSVLRVAAGEVASALENVTYFPSYEIVTGPQASFTSFAEDRRNVTSEAVGVVMGALLAHCEGGEIPVPKEAARGIIPADASSKSLAQLVVDAECEEVMSDRIDHPAPTRAEPAQRQELDTEEPGKNWRARPIYSAISRILPRR